MFLDKHGLMCFLHRYPRGTHFRGEVPSDTSSDSPYCGHVWRTLAPAWEGTGKSFFNSGTWGRQQHRTESDGANKSSALKMCPHRLFFSVRANSFDLYISLGFGAEKVLLTYICL